MVCSDAEILALQAKRKPYKHGTGEGLYILVNPDAKKFWRLKYRFNGTEKLMSLGGFPKVSAAEAIELRKHAKALLREGIDPSNARQQAKATEKSTSSKTSFRFDLSLNGELTVETATVVLRLTRAQTQALRSFLIIEPLETKELSQ